IGDPADQVRGNLNPVKLPEVALDLANRETAGIEADDPIIEPVEPGLSLRHDLRLEASLAVARHRDLDRPVIADHRLARIAVAAVAAVAPSRVAILVVRMLAKLGAERAFQQSLLQLLDMPILDDQNLLVALLLQT